jgi:hypothetical protein
MREEARIPAFAREIEDCGVLIGWFGGKFGGKVPQVNAATDEARVVAGVKELELRKVEDEPVGVVLDKKSEPEDPWASLAGTGGKKGKKGKKAPVAADSSADASAPPASTANPNAPVNLPYSLLTAILNLSIPPPSNAADVQRCVSDLEHKKAWFEANQKRKTEEEVARVEAVVKRMLKKANGANGDNANEDIAPEVNGAKEPLHTAIPTAPEVAVEQGDQVSRFPHPSVSMLTVL